MFTESIAVSRPFVSDVSLRASRVVLTRVVVGLAAGVRGAVVLEIEEHGVYTAMHS